jgi:hypothetical protein
MSECPSCGNDVQENLIFCKACGAELNAGKAKPFSSNLNRFLTVIIATLIMLSIIFIYSQIETDNEEEIDESDITMKSMNPHNKSISNEVSVNYEKYLEKKNDRINQLSKKIEKNVTKDDGNNTDISDPPEVDFGSIGDKIIFSVKEGYQGYYVTGDPQIIVTMRTEIEYPYYNYEISHTLNINDSVISIEFLEIHIPWAVSPAFGPATNTTFLNISDGEYYLNLSYKNVTDRYVLMINSTAIELTEIESNFTLHEISLWWRYPPKSFYYDCATPNSTIWIISDFLDNLSNEINITEFVFPDEGEIPYPRSGYNEIYTREVKYFYYQNEVDFERAGELLRSYVENVTSQYDGISITLKDWRNNYYFSWLMGD